MGDDAATLLAAALDDRYVIERELVTGGMAVVYLTPGSIAPSRRRRTQGRSSARMRG
jgi:hypothetical protein